MPRRTLAHDVLEAGLSRMLELYQGQYFPVVGYSGGKDSQVCLELAIEAATMTGRLPVHVSMRDDEIMFPGTFEVAERMAARPEVEFHWWVAHQPVINCFNRAQPYFWCFDPLLAPEQWVRQPPAFAKHITMQEISGIIHPSRFPMTEGQELIAVIGLRTAESPNRRMGLFNSGGFITKHKAALGVRAARPIYDWSDGDVWRYIATNGHDYNSAYDALLRLGIRRRALRIAPPTMNVSGIPLLQASARAWPRWFDLVTTRCPGTRSAAHFGKRAALPARRLGETWQECFERECITEAPAWIAGRASQYVDALKRAHAKHTTSPIPEVKPCTPCGQVASWKALAENLYGGDPFAVKATSWANLKPIDGDFFRPGSGTFGGGSPAFA